MEKINLFAQAVVNSVELQEKIRRGTDLILLSKNIGYDLSKVEINTGFDKYLKHVFSEIVHKEICSGQIDNDLMSKALKKCKRDKVLAEVKYVNWRLDEMKISTIIPFGSVIFSSIPFLVGCWFVSMMIGFINSGIMTIKSEAKSGETTTIYYSESPILFIVNIGFVGIGALVMFWATIWALKRAFKYWSWRKITNV